MRFSVFMLRGCPGRAERFAEIGSALAPRHYLLALSMPSYDGSEALPAPYDMGAATAAIEARARRWGLS